MAQNLLQKKIMEANLFLKLAFSYFINVFFVSQLEFQVSKHLEVNIYLLYMYRLSSKILIFFFYLGAGCGYVANVRIILV